MVSFAVSKDKVTGARADVIAIGVFKGGQLGPGGAEVERALGVSFQEVVEQSPLLKRPFDGRLDVNEALAVSTLGKLGAKQVVFVGLGERSTVTADTARKAGALVARKVGGARSVATTIPSVIKGKPEAALAAFAEGFLLGSYSYERYKNAQNGKPNRVETVTVLGSFDARAAKTAFARAQAMADGTNLARDLVNTPAGDKSPESLAAEAKRIAKDGLKVSILDEKQLAAKGFGGILGVGRGSPKPPRLIQLRYEPPGAKRTIALVGKGITFDSGGLDLKNAEGMERMKTDMGGGASVLGAMLAIARLKPKVRVHGYVASAENMPDGNATHPGDVITHYGGKTVEVMNTDAEGRLVMADAIVYAKENGADLVIDCATLTGACMIALGHWMFGVMAEPRSEAAKVLQAAERAGEPAWELPLFTPYRRVLESEIADMRNIANKNIGGGAITAGLFLKEFAGETPYVHLDIAGPSFSDEDRFEIGKGATGAGVRTIVEYVLSQ